ncbi:MAG: NAD-dependent epimerase/dehydratase family protein [bacterium]
MTAKIQLKRAGYVLLDIFLVNFATYMAYIIRGALLYSSEHQAILMKEYRDMMWLIILVVTTVRISTFKIFKLYKPLWRYASVGEFINILKSVTLGSAIFIVIMFIFRQFFYSRAVIAIDWALNLILIGMTKFSSRIYNEYRTYASGPETRVLIVGSGSTGQNALREMRNDHKKHYNPIGFIDDDPENHGKSVHGVEVLGSCKDIPSVVRRFHPDEILIAINSVSESKIKEISKLAEGTGVSVSLVPGIRSVSTQSCTPEKVLVIGGAGYIGSVMVRKLLQKGYKVKVLDSLIYGGESLMDLYDNSNFELIVGDFRHVDTVVHAAKGVDAIIHLGGIVGDTACELDPQFTREVNSAATRMIKGVCAGFGIKRFLFASTCSVYGSGDGILDETSPLNPLSLYARSKVDSERVLLEGNGNLSPTIFRMATVFGLSHRPRFDLVINLLAAKAAQGEEISIFGGYQWRPFVHVDDVAKAFIMCLESPLEKVEHQVFNVGDNSLNCQINDIGRIISELVPEAKIEHQTDITDKRNYRVSFDKIRKVLNFRCEKTIQDGVIEIRDAIRNGIINDYRDALFSNYLWLEKQREKGEIFFVNSHYE